MLVLFNDIPQTKAEREACLLKGGTKNEDIFQEVPEGFVSLSLPSLSRDWEGALGGKQWRCQQLVLLSAGGQVEKEASLNVREWIREADYASEVRAEETEKKKKGNLEQGKGISLSVPVVQESRHCMCERMSVRGSTCTVIQPAPVCSCSRVREWKW